MTPEGRQDLAAIQKALRAAYEELWQTYTMTPRVQPLFEQIEEAKRLLALLLAEAQRQENKDVTDTRVEDSQYGAPLATASDNKLVPAITGAQFGIMLSEYDREEDRENGMLVQILSEDDGNWHPHGDEFSSWWLRDLIHVLEAAIPETADHKVPTEGDVPETTTDNPKSWIAWKRRALAAETALREVVTNGEWRGGVEWVISTAVYEMATDAVAALPETSAPQEHEKDLTRMDRLSTSSDASRTAATDVAEGARSTTPNQKRSEAEFVADSVRTIIVEQLGVDDVEVTPAARFRDDLGCDSLDGIELIMSAEEEFGIDIPDDDGMRLETVQEAVDYIVKRRAAIRDAQAALSGKESR